MKNWTENENPNEGTNLRPNDRLSKKETTKVQIGRWIALSFDRSSYSKFVILSGRN